jgi:glutaredoxin
MIAKVYSQANCPGCLAAKVHLKNKGIPFTEIRIDKDEEAKAYILNKGLRSVPQVEIDGKFVNYKDI